MNSTFNTLSEAEKAERLAQYAQEDAKLGTKTVLARVVKAPKINDLKNGAKQAIIRLAVYDKNTKTTEYDNFFGYIVEGKEALESFYANLTKGQLVSCQYKENGGFKNIFTLMDRSASDKRVKEAVPAEKPDELTV